MKFISELQKRRSNYTHPDQATTQEQSLNQLSRGIYTEDERFIFELLQNAVDAFSKSDNYLQIRILLQDGFLVFMHNGDPFSTRDIEGLCDVGYGNKMNDSKKIGYKGIGFKSVFMRSSLVYVESSNFCFKFDKDHWNDYWERNWDPKFGKKVSEKHYGMPWQIIPLEATPPIDIKKDDCSVITYIKVENETILIDKITSLFSSSQFLLFLMSRNIKMEFSHDNHVVCSISKETKDDIVTLSSNGRINSRWLIYTNDAVEIPKELQQEISADINTPLKLKEANTFDLSFAIALDNKGKFRPLDNEESVIYTYLPTSYRFGFPFLVNANFITDAGRQQLHLDSIWNKLIFSKIPALFLSWMKDISHKYNNFHEILPSRNYGNGDMLRKAFDHSLTEAISTTPFIPCAHNKQEKICATSALMDRIEISKQIGKDVLAKHLNQVYGTTFNSTNFINPIWKGSKILAEYGVFIFDKTKLKELLENKSIFSSLTIAQNVELLEFLYDYCTKNKDEENELLDSLYETEFIYNEQKKLKKPSELYFPSSYKDQNELASDLYFIHHEINTQFKIGTSKQWLKHLGVKELDNKSFINHIFKNPSYINEENAIDIGRFLFEANKKEYLFDDTFIHNNRSQIKFLTQDGELLPASKLYLGSKYKPEINIEPVLKDNIFVSEKYITDGENLDAWKTFFIEMGINHDFSLQIQEWDSSEFNNYPMLNRALSQAKLKNNGPRYPFAFRRLRIEYFPLIELQEKNYEFAQIFWNVTLSSEYCNVDKSNIYGIYGWENWFCNYYCSFTIEELGETSFRKYLLKNEQLFPTTMGNLLKAQDIFENTEEIKNIGGSYLPIIAISKKIDESWKDILNFKSYLRFEDYLTILTGISEDKENISVNKERTNLIFQKLIDTNVLLSEEKTKQLREWAQNHKIISQDGELDFPCNLSHITLNGFASKSRVYIDSQNADNPDYIELLQILGVDVITEDNIHPDFGDYEENEELKNCLINKLSALSLLMFDEDKYESYADAKADLIRKLDSIRFYKCNKICLSYGDSEDVITKTTFCLNHDFYYTGDIRPSNLEPLMQPLCEILGIKGKKTELFVLLIENSEGTLSYLQEKGYNINLIENEPIVNTQNIFSTHLNYSSSTISEDLRNEATGYKGEILVYEYLKRQGYSPICPSISDETDYERKVTVNGKEYYCKKNFDKYDISIKQENGSTIFFEVKSTTTAKHSMANMPISSREWSMLDECIDSDGDSYYIVRVFNINSSSPEIYSLKGMKLDSETDLSKIL